MVLTVAVLALQKDGAHPAVLLFPAAAEVLVVVPALEQRVGDVRPRNEEPAQHVGIDLLECGKIHVTEGVGVGVYVHRLLFLCLLRLLLGRRQGSQRGRRQSGEVGLTYQDLRLLVGRLALSLVKLVPDHATQTCGKHQREGRNEDSTQASAH